MRVTVRRPTTRLAALAAALALTIGAQGAAALVGASPASAVTSSVTGLQKITGTLSASNSVASKTAPPAICPVGKRVIGGGGWVFTPNGADANKVGLTELRPVHPATGQDSYVVSAQELFPIVAGSWSVQAYAICANPVSGLNIVTSVSNPFSEVDAFCPVGQNVLGSGGRVDNPANHVGLGFVSPFLAGDRVRVAAGESRPFQTGDFWTVTSFAVCAPTPPGYQVVFAPSVQNQSEAQKVAFIRCPVGTRLHGSAGGAVPNTGVTLQAIFPFNALDQVEVFAVEATPSDFNWDVRAVAICAT